MAYSDPRLAAVYDSLNPVSDDERFYLELAGNTPRTVLDAGCGTGRLACELARRGHQVTGADPAAGMLGIARRRPGADAVRWIPAGAAELSVDTRFDLIVMTGHVFQVFLSDEEIRAALGNLARHLAPGGCLAFETRNAVVREWEEWIPEKTREEVRLPDGTIVDVHYDIRSVDGPLVTFETHFHFADNDVVVAPDTLRFMNQEELAKLLSESGLEAATWYGDWNCSPATSTSPEIIVIATMK